MSIQFRNREPDLDDMDCLHSHSHRIDRGLVPLLQKGLRRQLAVPHSARERDLWLERREVFVEVRRRSRDTQI